MNDLPLAQTLQAASEKEDWLAFEKLVIQVYKAPTSECTSILCKVLDEQHADINNDDIVETLQAIQDPAAVPSLIRALNWPRDFDEAGHLERKCIWALARIGTPEAREGIKGALKSEIPEVRDVAELALKNSLVVTDRSMLCGGLLN